MPTLAGVGTAPSPVAVGVTLAAPIEKQGPEQGQATRWSCAGISFRPLDARHGDARACREIAMAVGTIAAHEGTRGAVAADDLGPCNKAAG